MCYRIATGLSVPAPGASAARSEAEECRTGLFKPTSGILHCNPISSSIYRAVRDTYINYNSITVVAYGALTTAARGWNVEWASQCQYGNRCINTPNGIPPSLISEYAECTNPVLAPTFCGNKCLPNYQIPPEQYHCIQTKDWFGNPVTTINRDVQGLNCPTSTMPPPVHNCSCQTTPFCLKTGQPVTQSSVKPCSEDPAWTPPSQCGDLEHRQTFLKTAAGGFITEENCRNVGTNLCNLQQLTFAPVYRTMSQDVFNTVCKEALYCSSTSGLALSQTALCSSSNGSAGFPTCTQDNCDGSTQVRHVQCGFGLDSSTAITRIELNTRINTIPEQYRSSYQSFIQCSPTQVSSTRECQCQIRPWCRSSQHRDTPITTLTRADVVDCDESSDLAVPCFESCTAFNRNHMVCRNPNGSFREITQRPVDEDRNILDGALETINPYECGESTLPQCPRSHNCLSAEFCSNINIEPTIDSLVCSDTNVFALGTCYTFTNTNSELGHTEGFFELTKCTDIEAQTYYRRRNVKCLYYVESFDKFLPLPQGILNVPTTCQAPLVSTDRQPGCHDFSGCVEKIIGPPTISVSAAHPDNTIYHDQFHEHGFVHIGWSYHGPPTTQETVLVEYALALTEIVPTSSVLTWVAFPQRARLGNSAGGVAVQFPVIGHLQSNGQIFIRISLESQTNTDRFHYYPQPIVVYSFNICADLKCEDRTEGNFECFVQLDESFRMKPAICRCDTTVDVLWVSSKCSQTQSCLDLSVRCQNDGQFLFDRDEQSLCSTQCSCPGKQLGQFCEGECKEGTCNRRNGVVPVSSKSCNCSKCHAGFSGISCNLCSRLTALRITDATNSAPQLFGTSKRRDNFIKSVSQFFSSTLGVATESVQIDGQRTTLTSTTLTLVVLLNGQCSEANFQPEGLSDGLPFTTLQSGNDDSYVGTSLSQVINAWNNLDVTALEASTELKSLTLGGFISQNTKKEQIVDPVSCLRQKDCPEFTQLSCTGEFDTDHPECVGGKGVNGKLILSVLLPIFIILAIVMMGVGFWYCGCCSTPPPKEGDKKDEKGKQKGKKSSSSSRDKSRTTRSSARKAKDSEEERKCNDVQTGMVIEMPPLSNSIPDDSTTPTAPTPTAPTPTAPTPTSLTTAMSPVYGATQSLISGPDGQTVQRMPIQGLNYNKPRIHIGYTPPDNNGDGRRE
jgi:hypothetical protein